MKRRFFAQFAGAVATALTLALVPAVQAAEETPDVLIKRLSDEVLAAIKSDKALQSGENSRIMALVPVC